MNRSCRKSIPNVGGTRCPASLRQPRRRTLRNSQEILKVPQCISNRLVGVEKENAASSLTEGKDNLMVKFACNQPQEHGQCERRDPKEEDMRVRRKEFERFE